MESFDISPVLSLSLAVVLLFPNTGPNCSKPLLFDKNCPLLLLPLVLLPSDFEGAATKSSKSLSFVALVASEITESDYISNCLWFQGLSLKI